MLHFISGKLFAIVVIVIFALIMSLVMYLIKKLSGSDTLVSPRYEEPDFPNKDRSFFERYCNDKKNDNYRARAKWIMLHDNNERENRGQDNSI